MLKAVNSRSQFGLILIHLALDGHSPEIRREAYKILDSLTLRAPKLTNRVIRDSLNAFITRRAQSLKSSTLSPEEQTAPWNKHLRLSMVLLHTVSFADDVSSALREEMVINLLILGHHELICTVALYQ